MARKTTFTKNDVVLAALAVVDAEGITQLSARRTADKLGASTAPVYSNFANMEDLGAAVKMMAVEKMMQLTEKTPACHEFLGIGQGVLEFARDHPRLYEALFLQAVSDYDPGLEIMDRILDKMATLPSLMPLQPIERLILLKKMALFTHGMATEICHGFLDNYRWRELVLLLDEVGEALVTASFNRLPRTEQDEEILGTFWSKCRGYDHNENCLKPEGDNDD